MSTPTIVPERLAQLESLTLDKGSHASWEQGACVMEAVAYVAGEPFSDSPACASPIITSFLVSWNDSLPDADRQFLKPYIPRLVGTRTTKKDEKTRAWLLTDWLARECAPAFLSLAGLTEHARLLEGLAPLTSAASARKAQPTLDEARKAGDAAWAAARFAARFAAWAAAWDAARDAAGAAARAAARAAAGDAAGDAARDAARDALAPTVKTLQASALLLLDRLISVGKREAA
ncbi:MAG TPA: hypothetical protein VNJ54_12640 [Plantibacter sp.]|uniref:hypothetical protein n=1 Tax=Plantibacter sp. TaxID=1871045 RepID=UPI002C5E9DFB|nr:hypothetical protein [Plantibacter sp.]